MITWRLKSPLGVLGGKHMGTSHPIWRSKPHKPTLRKIWHGCCLSGRQTQTEKVDTMKTLAVITILLIAIATTGCDPVVFDLGDAHW